MSQRALVLSGDVPVPKLPEVKAPHAVHLTCACQVCQATLQRDHLEVTAFGDGNRQYVPGVRARPRDPETGQWRSLYLYGPSHLEVTEGFGWPPVSPDIMQGDWTVTSGMASTEAPAGRAEMSSSTASAGATWQSTTVSVVASENVEGLVPAAPPAWRNGWQAGELVTVTRSNDSYAAAVAQVRHLKRTARQSFGAATAAELAVARARALHSALRSWPEPGTVVTAAVYGVLAALSIVLTIWGVLRAWHG